MRAKRVYEFLKSGDVKSSLGIGRVAKIRKLFREYGIPDKDYNITDMEVIFYGDLNLSGTNVSELPEGLRVYGDLNLRGTKISKLSSLLLVKDLILSGTPITELPENLKVKGTLYLNSTPITKLPEGLSVRGSLNLSMTPLTELPEGLSVGFSIYVNESQKELRSHILSSKFSSKLVIW